MTNPTGEAPPPAEASAAHAPAAPPPAASARAEPTPIVEVRADPMMAQVIQGSAGGTVVFNSDGNAATD